ncbi:ankyrin [Zopfia rhizophila CBS 207.26]|uniref:Ankyrin n=1 Tax=Zopfia rhizophila CBS 207.26 TaxID=1314779 RepID=A0A6A6D714_9PEZI|nr:ankyrin [Zopfia rhizophila CBS 207.26]
MPFPPSTNPPTVSDKDCAICHEPLLVPSSNHGQPSYLIDDVEFRCKHHFHWGCILEYSISSFDARNRCALCRQSVLNSKGEFIVQVRNEGGFISGFDFGDEIDRHLFYKANPEAEREMTFLSLMSQMDFSDAELFLKGEDPDANGKMDPNVCYSSGRMTAMHMAALNDDVEGIQLLLKYGADKEFKSEDGQTALDMAKAENSKRVIALLMAE